MTQKRGREAALSLVLAAAALAGCGTRLSHERLLADARREGTVAAAATAGVAGSTVAAVTPVAGDAVTAVSAAGDPGALHAPPGPAATATAAGGARSAGRGTTTPAGAPSGERAGPPGTAQPRSGSAPSSAPSAAATPGGPAGAAKPACQDTSAITIGTVGQQSGLVAQNVLGGVRAVQVWVAQMNASGGLRCHPLKYLVVDDGGDASRHQAMVKDLVENRGVLAFVYMDAPLSGSAAVSYLTDKGVPVVGSEAASPWFYSSPVYFPQVSSGDLLFGSSIGAASVVAKPLGLSKLAVLACLEASVCSNAYNLAPAYAEKFGFNLVYRAQASLTQPDFTAQCQAAMAAGAQILYMGFEQNSVRRIARSCRSVNYKPLFVGTSVAMPKSLASDPLLDNAVVGQVSIPWFQTSNSGIVEFQAALKRHAPGQDPDAATVLGWLAAKLFGQAALAAPEPITSRGVLDALAAMKGNDLGGMTLPLSFQSGRNAPPTLCFWTTQFKKGEVVSPNNGERSCP